MDTHDLINGGFGLLMSAALFISVVKAWRIKKVRGVHWLTPTFFTIIGLWNVVYFTHLQQPWSLAASVVLLAVDVLWTTLVLLYSER